MVAALAQTASKADAMADVLWLSAILCVLIVVVAVVALWVRRRLLAGPQSQADPGFSLSDLRRLRSEGAISEQEFRAAREQMILASRAMFAGGEDDEDFHSPSTVGGPDNPAADNDFHDRPDNGDDPLPPPRAG